MKHNLLNMQLKVRLSAPQISPEYKSALLALIHPPTAARNFSVKCRIGLSWGGELSFLFPSLSLNIEDRSSALLLFSL